MGQKTSAAAGTGIRVEALDAQRAVEAGNCPTSKADIERLSVFEPSFLTAPTRTPSAYSLYVFCVDGEIAK